MRHTIKSSIRLSVGRLTFLICCISFHPSLFLCGVASLCKGQVTLLTWLAIICIPSSLSIIWSWTAIPTTIAASWTAAYTDCTLGKWNKDKWSHWKKSLSVLRWCWDQGAKHSIEQTHWIWVPKGCIRHQSYPVFHIFRWPGEAFTREWSRLLLHVRQSTAVTVEPKRNKRLFFSYTR